MIVMCFGCAAPTTTEKEKVDLLVFGKIFTAAKGPDGNVLFAEAAAVKDGKFVFVGSAADAESRYSAANVEDYRNAGGLVMPGMVEGHTHTPLYMITPLMIAKDEDVRLSYDCDFEGGLKQQLQDLYKKSPDKKQYRGSGWNNAMFKTPPTAAMLDEVFGKDTKRIVILTDSSGHSLWMNTYAMEQVGIAGKVDSGMIPGGVIEVDEEGNSIGCVRDNAVNYVMNSEAIEPHSRELYENSILLGGILLLSLGITDTFEGCTNFSGDNGFAAYKALEEKGLLTGNYHLSYRVNANDMDSALEKALAMRDKIGEGKHYHLDTVKGFADGVMETKTCRLIEPYENMKHPATGEDYYGFIYDPCFTTEQATELVKKANEAGFRAHFHAIGDGAVATAVDGIIAGQTSPEMRNAVTHLQLVPEEYMQKMSANNIVAVTNPYWHYKENGTWDNELKYFGEERAEKEYPLKSFYDANCHVFIASDHPAGGDPALIPNTFLAIHHAMTRLSTNEADLKSGVLGPDQRMEGEAGLTALLLSATVEGAYQLGDEQTKGSIEVGKDADFIHVTHDPYELIQTEEGIKKMADLNETYADDVFVAGEKVELVSLLNSLEPEALA